MHLIPEALRGLRPLVSAAILIDPSWGGITLPLANRVSKLRLKVQLSWASA